MLDAPSGHFAVIGAGQGFSCALDADGYLTCWGGVFLRQERAMGKPTLEIDGVQFIFPPSDARFATLSVGYEHACGVLLAGGIRCWGWNGSGEATPPAEFAPKR
jgi:alpha-tubulin suppressor-like RCC1 family protein